MQTIDFIRKQSETVQFQVEAVFQGMDPSRMDEKLTPHSYSPRETLVHLCDCAAALQDAMDGREHSWGSYVPSSNEVPDLMNEWKEIRTRAIEAALANPTDEALREVSDYVILHDAYHVGQLVAFRLATEPDWNAYAIYG